MLGARERSFTVLHSEHFGRIYRYIAYRINDADRAEELAADVFRIAWEKDLPEQPGIGWLVAAARNVVANEYKGRHRQQLLRRRLQDQVRAAAATNDNESNAVADVLAKLNDKQREVLMLAYWDGLTTAELAESLGCSLSAAGVRLHRARKSFAGMVPAHLMNERTA
ncbi:RNA polymerase sigma-70 factor (ECF subfamily) [Arthrobacter sp. PvP023]|uniref:RNA polymerase sigma factor n=1 Tax=Micrococcaceae TaxID=1268 RepID=UPI001AEAC050|nr:sigma-70 family RNA polymerase sigma factor [Arthrobacter sp. PvP023]MBP1136826.1 RNA polymerase sigma-70 factor (ECF subfamily) [Arthrobacter sp. PvP023]